MNGRNHETPKKQIKYSKWLADWGKKHCRRLMEVDLLDFVWKEFGLCAVPNEDNKKYSIEKCEMHKVVWINYNV